MNTDIKVMCWKKEKKFTKLSLKIFQFANLAVKVDPADVGLRKSILELRSELQNISMMDEFARYAKIERRIIQLSEERKKLRKYHWTGSSPGLGQAQDWVKPRLGL